MRRGVANNVETVGVLFSDDGERRVVIDQRGCIDELAVELAAQRSLRESRANRCSDFRNRDGVVVLSNRPVGQTYRNHFVLQDAGGRRPISFNNALQTPSQTREGKKNAAPHFEGPHSLFLQLQRRKWSRLAS